MKKQLTMLVLAALFLSAASTVSAQRFGIKAGLNLANVSGDAEDTKMLPTFLVGGQAEFDLGESGVGIGVGVQLSGKGFKQEFGGDDFKLNPMYLQVPIQLIYRNGGFFGAVGPYAGFGIAGKAKFAGESESIEFGSSDTDDWAALDFGAGVEAGYEFSAGSGLLRATASYNLGLSNVVPKDIADAEDVSVKNNVIGIALAFLFGGGE